MGLRNLVIGLTMLTTAACASNFRQAASSGAATEKRLREVTPIETKTGRRPVVEYFFSPSCKACSGSDEFVEKLHDLFGRYVNVQAWCITRESHFASDFKICLDKYGQNPSGGSGRLSELGGTGIPQIYVSGELVGGGSLGPTGPINIGTLCQALGYDASCLD